MASQEDQDKQGKGLLDGIQGEVSAENAPLLRFITKYAGVIAGVVLAILLILGGMAIWNWQHGLKQREAREELDRINQELKGADRDNALNDLAKNAPDSVKLFIYMSLGKSAQENGNPVLAAEAYAKAAELDGDGALGLTAALGSAGSLLMQAEYLQALTLLQELERRLPSAANSPQLQQMLAEAAYRAGRLELAQATYAKLAKEITTPEADYFRSRAEAIAAEMAAKGRPAEAPGASQ